MFNHINGNLYHYAGNNPVRYIDPDGREVTNNTGDYIIAKPEDEITLKDGTTLNTVVLAPGDTYVGKVDGTRDKDGNYTKISGLKMDNIDYSVETGNRIKFNNASSRDINNRNDILKKINNFLSGKKLLSGSYSKDSDGGKFLSSKWDGEFKEDLGENFDNYEAAYSMESQVKLRAEHVITQNKDKK